MSYKNHSEDKFSGRPFKSENRWVTEKEFKELKQKVKNLQKVTHELQKGTDGLYEFTGKEVRIVNIVGGVLEGTVMDVNKYTVLLADKSNEFTVYKHFIGYIREI